MSDPLDPAANGKTQANVGLPNDTQVSVTPVDDATLEAGAHSMVPDPAEQEAPKLPPRPVKAYGATEASPTSDSLAAPSRKARRQQRDRRAEGRAIQVLLALFVGLGGLALLAVNVLLEDAPPEPPVAVAVNADVPVPGPVVPPPPPKPSGVMSSKLVETVDLPALRKLKYEGLTIAAEGLPEVSSGERGVGPVAARETCRFAYGVWEFSPNKRFRFLPTCPSMDGQVLFGAYTVFGGTIRMSPLRVGGVELISEFRVEKPSRLVSRVTVGGGRYTLEVRQRVTVIRGGLMGDAFYDTYAPKNTLSAPAPVQGRSVRPPPPSEPSVPPPKKKQDPLLELLRGSKKQ